MFCCCCVLVWWGLCCLGFFFFETEGVLKKYLNVLLVCNDFCKYIYKRIPIVHGYILKTQGTTLILDATHNPCLSTAKSVLSQGVVDRIRV